MEVGRAHKEEVDMVAEAAHMVVDSLHAQGDWVQVVDLHPVDFQDRVEVMVTELALVVA